jgi:hypothetical protein
LCCVSAGNGGALYAVFSDVELSATGQFKYNEAANGNHHLCSEAALVYC